MSDFVFALSVTSSFSAAVTRSLSSPLERRASAKSLLSCAVGSLSGVDAGLLEGGSVVDGKPFAAFSASSAVARSRSVVSGVIRDDNS